MSVREIAVFPTHEERIMMSRLALIALILTAGSSPAAALVDSLKKGTPALKSISSMTFGPEGILFIGDPVASSIVAIDTGDRKAAGQATVSQSKIDEKLAALFGTMAKDIRINDMKVNPASGNVYFAVTRGTGSSASALVVKLDRAGEMTEVSMKDIPFATVMLPNTNEKRRMESITSLSYADGKVIVAGLSNEDFASKLRVIPFPFTEADPGASVEIYHGAHGKFETASPVRTFTTYKIAEETHVLAAYTCTPLVKFPLNELKAGPKIVGQTIAELGNRNQPLDMVVYSKGGKDYVLMANSSRGVMKISTEGIAKIEPITKRISGTSGLKYDTIADLKGVMQLDKLDAERALVLVKKEDGVMNLETIPLP